MLEGQSPMAAFAWAFIGLIVAIPVMQILRGWAEGSIEALPGIGLVGGIMLLLTFTWKTQGTIWMLLFVALLLGVCAAGPFVAIYIERRGHRELREDDIARCRRAIEADPENAGAHAFLGDALMQSRSYVAASAQYEKAIALSARSRADWSERGERFDPDERGNPALESWKRKLRAATEAQAGIRSPTRLLVCDCGTENPPARKKCERCGARLQVGFGK